MNCPHCQGPLIYLGTLGNKDAMRCRDCGSDLLVDRPDDECPIGAETYPQCPDDRSECCAAVCPHYNREA